MLQLQLSGMPLLPAELEWYTVLFHVPSGITETEGS
jgi:hypothetical protein